MVIFSCHFLFMVSPLNISTCSYWFHVLFVAHWLAKKFRKPTKGCQKLINNFNIWKTSTQIVLIHTSCAIVMLYIFSLIELWWFSFIFFLSKWGRERTRWSTVKVKKFATVIKWKYILKITLKFAGSLSVGERWPCGPDVNGSIPALVFALCSHRTSLPP